VTDLSESAESVRKMLTRLARSRDETPETLFRRYARERLLCRLSRSEHAAQFVLKGASLFYVWTAEPHRPTKDIDLLGLGPLDAQAIGDIFRQICTVDGGDDGLEFDPRSVSTEEIREDADYGGVRVRLSATLTKARLRVQVDVGLGDLITPATQLVEYPMILPELALKPFRLRVYPKEAVVAEKAETMVKLGMMNSRMKDFYDIAEIARSLPFDGSSLTQALSATFGRRGTALPRALPVALTDDFVIDATKQTQWQGFLRRAGLPFGDLEVAVCSIRGFLWPPFEALGAGGEFVRTWLPGGPWT
jgi:hypothetical protein